MFERLPKLVAFLRCAIDIRNVDVPAASKAGVLVTQASAGFVTSVTELVLGFLVDLSRGITRSCACLSCTERFPRRRWARELKGSTLGVIGYGAIGREVVRVGKALGMRVLVNDPYVNRHRAGFARRAAFGSPITSCRSPSRPRRRKT